MRHRLPSRPGPLATVLLLASLTSCGLTEEDTRVCAGVTCSAGYCIAEQGRPVCHCGAWEQALGETCDVVPPLPEDTDRTPEGATPLAPSAEPQTFRFDPSRPDAVDLDYFRFEASAGHIYRVACTSSLGCGLRLLDARHVSVVSQEGWEGATLHAELATAGLFYVQVQHRRSGAGDYSLRFEDLGTDDVGDSAQAALPRAPSPEPFSGRLELPGDRDVFSFSATAGRVYRLACTTSTSDPGAWSVEVRDATGQLRAEESGIRGQATTGLKASTTGTLFAEVRAEAEAGSGGNYMCRLEDLGPDDHGDTPATATHLTPRTEGPLLSGRLEVSSDEDVFTFTATPGHLYRFDYTRAGDALVCQLRLEGDASFSETSYIPAQVIDVPAGTRPFLRLRHWGETPYSYRLEDLGLDDHGSSAATATSLTPGLAVQAHVAGLGDMDVLTFSATARRLYRLTVSPPPVTWQEFNFRMEGQVVRAGAARTTEPASLQYTFQPMGDGPMLLEFQGKAMRYQVLLEDAVPQDDGDTRDTATPVGVGEARAGIIDVGKDVDVFTVTLEANRRYELLTASTSSLVFFSVSAPDGREVPLSAGEGGSFFTSAEAGTYAIQVAASLDGSGLAYQLTVR
jgi:hypothetical protein